MGFRTSSIVRILNNKKIKNTTFRKQVQFPKRHVFIFELFKVWTMDEVRKPINSVCYTTSSEPYKI
jgi:hypothetical protein